MSKDGKPMGPGSRILRERALKILRETRAKIDPQLLEAMKERLSATMPPGSIPGVTPAPQDEAMSLLKKETVFKPEIKPVEVVPDKPVTLTPSGAEPVDRQKIAQIVLEYMKQREETKKH